MTSKETKSVSVAMIEDESAAHDETIGDWIPRRGAWLGPATVLFAFLVGNLTGFLLDDVLDRRSPPSPAPVAAESKPEAPALREAAPTTADVPPEAAPLEAPEEVEVAPPEVARRRVGTRKRPRATGSPVEALAFVELSLSTNPAGAWVSVDGVRYGRTPITVVVPPQPELQFRFEKEGYVASEVRWAASQGRSVNETLRPRNP